MPLIDATEKILREIQQQMRMGDRPARAGLLALVEILADEEFPA
jgi:hypothetical protein